MKVSFNKKRTAIVQFLIGLALLSVANDMNSAGQVNWSTVLISAVGFICVLLAVIDFFQRNA